MKLPANTQVLCVYQFFDKNDRECTELVREKKHNFVGTEPK